MRVSRRTGRPVERLIGLENSPGGCVKRGTIEHPKMIMLASTLACPRHAAVGILECLWHFTARYAPRGDVGKFSDDVIANAIEWKNDPKTLIEALIKCGWLEHSDKHRIVVHDWSHHADDGVNKYLKRCKDRFFDGSKPYDKGKTAARKRRASVTPSACPPEPLPLPSPEPSPSPPTPSSGARKRFDTFWTEYPRKDSKQVAVKSFEKLNPSDELFGRIIAHVRTMKASEQWTRDGGRFIPMPATYLNQKRWEDEGVAPGAVAASDGLSAFVEKQKAKEAANASR